MIKYLVSDSIIIPYTQFPTSLVWYTLQLKYYVKKYETGSRVSVGKERVKFKQIISLFYNYKNNRWCIACVNEYE